MGEIRPHLVRYWLHSSDFAEKVNEICTVYLEAGGYTISVDEMTGIQALEHKYPDKPVIPGKAACMEFEYIRHGTTSLTGFFDVATGRMEQPCLNPTRTEDDFVEALRALVETVKNLTIKCVQLTEQGKKLTVKVDGQQKQISRLTDKVMEQSNTIDRLQEKASDLEKKVMVRLCAKIVADTDLYETDKEVQNLIDWVCLSEQIFVQNGA